MEIYKFLYCFVRYWNWFKWLIGKPHDPEWLTELIDDLEIRPWD